MADGMPEARHHQCRLLRHSTQSLVTAVTAVTATTATKTTINIIFNACMHCKGPHRIG
jgi:hypothetical protein